MQHCWIRGHKKVIFEGDCKELTQLLQGHSLNFGIHNWIREITHWKGKFESVIFQWIGRARNKAADQLTKSSMPRNTNFVYHFYIPRVLTDILHEDLCMATQH
ncbi:Ribonuclease H-like superfamily [Arabidopsis suecica]|uniref:Ribonuclease H-like superfamily n=1 Tax=Arabidopsis suecica TaxID=45249 RepID=A0A8T2CMJ2_ARASU|nr:Ribonuclease H-like superfamily [Arabidopsis suecica]